MRTFVVEEYDGAQLVERRVIKAESWDHLAERINQDEGIPRVKPKPQPEDDDVFGVAV